MIEMGFEELFVRFWWLIFPIFGMVMAFWGMASSERRSRQAMDTIKSYVEQGKEPPAELLEVAAGSREESGDRRRAPGGSAVVFTALAVAALLGSRVIGEEQAANWLLVGSAFFGVLALGFAFMLIGSRPEK